MLFKEITGHREEIRKLVTMADSGKLPHALLFHGPSGVGKMLVARAFIQYLYCESPAGGDACGKCANCLQTSKMNNPDVHFMFPIVKSKGALSSDFLEEWKEFLQVSPYASPEEWLRIIDAGNSRPIIATSESEELLRISSLSSYGDGYKTFVIWLPEKMNPDAANRLLKVIEEPFSDTIFILVSNSPGEILPTIKSRLQALEFRPLEDQDVIAHLCNISGLTYEEASTIAKISKGNLNKATMLADSRGETAEFTEDFMGVMRGAYSRNMPALKNYSETFAAYGREKSLRLLDYFARMTRESFISNLHCKALETMTEGEKKFVERFGPFINAGNVEQISREIDRASQDISRNANQKIVWFDFLIDLTRLIRTSAAGPAARQQ